ncbi:MAG: PIG-L family deacetylase, partial [Rhodothermales bacterium]|nr:PIG-L family deacetylase [Rhodothermales bacterium]
MNVRLPLLFVAVALFAGPLHAQGPVDEPAPLVVMNLAAHPDDEDGLTLAYYRHAKDAVAHSVIYTRGEGGQNEIGPDLYERLGAIRTEETERAARRLGTQVRFLNFYDFGYSKSADEAFREWGGRDGVTARLVYLVRKLKPDVLFTNHDTVTVGPRRQHGHHQAVGLSAYDAFALAADPQYHPEQLEEEGVDLWQPKRLFLRLWRGPGDRAVDAKVPVGDALGRTGMSAADLAVQAAAEHRSQGFDKFAPRFHADTTYFVLLREAEGVPPLPEGAADLAAGLPPNPHAADTSVRYLIDSERVVPLTAPLHGSLPEPNARLALGPFLTVSDSVAVPGQTVTVRWPAAEEDGLVTLVLTGAIEATFDAVAGKAEVTIPPDAQPTLPKPERQYDRFVSSPPIQAVIRRADGTPLAAGHLPLEIAPTVTLELAPGVVRLQPGANTLPYRVRVDDPAADSAHVQLVVTRPPSPLVRGRVRPLVLEAQTVPAGDAWTDHAFAFTLPADVAPGDYTVHLEARTVPTPDVWTPASATRDARVLPDVAVPEGLRVGIVTSYDDTTEEALRQMGAEVVALDSAALAAGAFDGLDTIVLDIRAYLVRPDLRAHNAKLLDWVRGGGHLVVNYHKTFEWNPGQRSGGFFDEVIAVPDAGFAPYPLTLGRQRVTVEEAPVTLLQPDHVLFHAPNAIRPEDWEGWVQERGLYFPAAYDDRYVELLAMNDPGEAPLRSSTLIAAVGDGTYVYTALGWYRQLAEYHPGAYRLFANL